MSQLFLKSVCLVEQHIGIVTLSSKVYFHTKSQGVNLLKVKVILTQNGAFLLVQYLWIFAMIRVLTSYSKDKRVKDAKHWSFSQKVKGQPSCNSLVALYFWQNIFTPLNHRCIQLRKHIQDGDRKTPRTSKDKRL